MLKDTCIKFIKQMIRLRYNRGTFSNKDCITCEKLLKGLSTRDTYTVSVKPYNDDGVGDESNKISFTPIGELRTYDFNINSPIENLLGDDYEHCN